MKRTMQQALKFVVFVAAVTFLVAMATVSYIQGAEPTAAPRIEVPLADYRVIDGDTYEVTVSVTFPLRIVGVDTPELRDPRQKAAATVAADVARQWLKDAPGPLAVVIYRLGMYGRIEGDLVDRSSGEKISMYLFRRGVAFPSVGKRFDWPEKELRKIEAIAIPTEDDP